MTTDWTSLFNKDGAHYNIFRMKSDGMELLREMFPGGEANELNFVLFSTSGVHGSYTTIERIEHSLRTYGEDGPADEDDYPEDYCPSNLTVLIVHPRMVCMRYTGSLRVTLADIPYLKKLRASSWEAVQGIGR